MSISRAPLIPNGSSYLEVLSGTSNKGLLATPGNEVGAVYYFHALLSLRGLRETPDVTLSMIAYLMTLETL